MIKIITPIKIIISHLIVAGNIILFSSAFVKVPMRFNWFLGKSSRIKLNCVIFLDIGDPGETESLAKSNIF